MFKLISLSRKSSKFQVQNDTISTVQVYIYIFFSENISICIVGKESLFPQFHGVDAEYGVLRRPFGYYLTIASHGTLFAAKWSSNGGLEAVVSK